MPNLPRLFLLAVSFSMVHGQAISSDVDVRAVRNVIDQYMRARNNKNAEAVGKLFTPDADQLVSTGEWRKGLDSLVSGMAASSKKEAGHSTITVETVRLIDADVAIVDGRYDTTSLNGSGRSMWTTVVLKRTKGEWRITAIRNMLPAPVAAAH